MFCVCDNCGDIFTEPFMKVFADDGDDDEYEVCPECESLSFEEFNSLELAQEYSNAVIAELEAMGRF